MKTGFTVVVESGYVKVLRGSETICAAVDDGNRRLSGIEFMRPEFQKCNRTRQAAMKAYQMDGWK